jgi:alkaline phosphatase
MFVTFTQYTFMSLENGKKSALSKNYGILRWKKGCMNAMKRKFFFILATVAILLSMCVVSTSASQAYAASPTSGRIPKYVFLFIGDGMGGGQRQLAEYAYKKLTGDSNTALAMNSLPYGGNLTTTPKDGTKITDSAAAGSAMATGVKHDNGTLAIDGNGKPIKTIAELAKANGRSLGILSNGKVAGATPASFTSHIKDRDLANEIAEQQLSLEVDYFACSGYRNLVPQSHASRKSEREDDRDLVGEYRAKGYHTFISESDSELFRQFKPQKGSRVLAAFTAGSYPYEIDTINKRTDAQIPSLLEATQKGIEVLQTNENGFFFMIEDDVLDDCGHYNDAAGTIHNVLALDSAVKSALDFYKNHESETLIVVAADHETGGLGIGTGFDYDLNIDYLLSIKGSTEGNLKYEKNDRGNYYQLVKEIFNFEPTEEQKRLLEIEMGKLDAMDEIPDIEDNALYQLTIDMINDKANIGFTTWEHTANPIPFTAIGIGAEKLNGIMENTLFGMRLAAIMGLNLGVK